MRKFQIVIFVLAMLISSTQTLRHVYVKWIEPHDSVLDRFRDKTESEIAASKSLDDLIHLYEKAYNAVRAYEDDSTKQKIESNERDETEPYRSEYKIRNEIQEWESRNRRIFELRFFWLCGLLSVVIGLFVYDKINIWLGMSGILVGFSEMLCWTSPLFRGGAWGGEFERLLNHKLTLSLLSWILLVTLWVLLERGKILRKTEKAG